MPDAVTLRDAVADQPAVVPLATRLAAAHVHDDGVDLDGALEVAQVLGAELPRPGRGDTVTLWESLASLGATDLTVARVVEPHLDALAILDEAGSTAPTRATFGVYAAEGPGARLVAAPVSGATALSGRKPWCSLADRVTHALVTAWVDDSTRGLFLVDLADVGVQPDPDSPPWAAHGLSRVTSTGLVLKDVPALPIGAPGWYLERPGFSWGGIGVAAVWHGGAVGVARQVLRSLRRREPDQIAQLQLGLLDTTLAASRQLLVGAAGAVDSGRATGADGVRLALQVRQQVAATVETTLQVADHALGPGPLATDATYARRVSDLRLYVRQHHAERDAAALGRAVLDADEATWP